MLLAAATLPTKGSVLKRIRRDQTNNLNPVQGYVSKNKIAKNHPGTYVKLPCKGELNHCSSN